MHGVQASQDGRDAGVRLDIADGKFILGLVARFDHLKNQSGFLEFASHICEFSDSYRFLMIGDGVVGNEK